MEKEQLFTVITGASKGLGKAFAQVCAQQGRNLLLISLPGENLREVSQHLMETYHIQVEYFETDLTQSKNTFDLIKKLNEFKLEILINNAGVGGSSNFREVPIEDIESLLLLNINSLVLLTHQLLPNLNQRNQAYVLNIASLAAFAPIPFKTVYAASKTFVSSFTRSLNEELRSTNIHLAVAYPGGMKTNGNSIGTINSLGPFLRLSILTPEENAVICLKLLLRKKKMIVPGRINWLGSMLQRIVPENFQSKLYRDRFGKKFNAAP